MAKCRARPEDVRILALDLARVAGAAWHTDDKSAFFSRAFTLGKPGDVGAHLVELERVVYELIDEARPDLVSIERDTGRGAGSRTLSAYHAVATMCAQRRGIRAITKIMPLSARKLALGYGMADKLDAAKTAAAVLGVDLSAISLDEVDAIILLEATTAWLVAEDRRKALKKAAAKSGAPIRRRRRAA